jgi:cytochrome c oxidase assembly factor CtaG/cytochrome c2
MRAVILDWDFAPWVVVSLAVASLWYAAGLWRISRRAGLARIIRPHEIYAFTAGMLTLFIALLSPIDTVGEQLFSVHMVQHLMLMMVAAPLFAWSRPALVLLWALPPKGRKVMGRAWAGFGLRGAIRGLMHPITVWVLFSGAFVFWHFPVPYSWALQNELVHALEHLSFFITALMFWTIVLEPDGYRRLGYGATLIFVATNGIVSGLPGALMILATQPLYPVHADRVAAWHMTLLQDQQLAGVIMWIPGGLAYAAATCFAFVKWLSGSERAVVARHGHRALISSALLVLLLPLVSGCKDHGRQAIVQQVGNPAHGAKLIRQFGCGACHVVPGIENADGDVGPPLVQVGRRIYIAGMLRNTPPNMVRWVQNPQAVVPGNVMPDMGIDLPDAKDIAAYLYTLR